MTDNVCARDLMIGFETISPAATFGDALEALVALQQRKDLPNALVIAEPDGTYDGLVTSRLLARALWTPAAMERSDSLRLGDELLAGVQDRLATPIRDAVPADVPTVGPNSRLLEMIAAGHTQRIEFLPVLDDGKIQGLVPVTALFQATAAIALTPEDEGIRFDQPKDG